MDRHLPKWKHSVERIWSAAAPDYGEAACHAAGFWNCPRRAMRWRRRGERTRPGMTGMSTISVVSAIYFGDEPRWCGSWSGSRPPDPPDKDTPGQTRRSPRGNSDLDRPQHTGCGARDTTLMPRRSGRNSRMSQIPTIAPVVQNCSASSPPGRSSSPTPSLRRHMIGRPAKTSRANWLH